MANIIGTSIVPRTETKLFSFDRAFHVNKVGFPAIGMMEVYGASHVGKSTFLYSLAAILGNLWNSHISLADLEGLDQEFLLDIMTAHKFENNIMLVQEVGDEEVMGRLLELYESEDEIPTKIGILDSVGSISPIQELEGDLGDANMGRRARIMAQFSRKFTHLLIGRNDKILMPERYSNVLPPGVVVPTDPKLG